MEKDFNAERQEIERDLWEIKERLSLHSKFETILKLYSIIGLVIAIFSFIYFIISSLNITLTKTQQITLLISGTGVLLSLSSWFLLVIRRERKKEAINKFQSMQILSDFIFKWAQFESVSKEILKSHGKKFNRFSIREIIDRLNNLQLIEKEDVLLLEEAIQARNMIVHGGNFFPKDLITRYSNQIDKIILKLLQKKKKSNK